MLTTRPSADVIINVVPTETRTYNADEAFNPDAAYGENKAKQVRVATDRTLVQLGGTPTAGEYWIVALTGTDKEAGFRVTPTLGVDAFLDNAFQKLGDSTISGTSSSGELGDLEATGSKLVYEKVTSQSLTQVAALLASQITNLAGTIDYTAVMTPGLAVKFTGAVAQGAAWALTLDGVATPFSYNPVAGNTLSDVARALADAINAVANLPGDYKATADGDTLLILDPLGTASFGAALAVGGVNRGAVGVQAPQILITTTTTGAAFYTEFAIGIATDAANTAAPKVRPQALGFGDVMINRTKTTDVNPNKFVSVAVEMKGTVTAGEVWTLQLKDVSQATPSFANVAQYTTKFGDTLSDIAADLGRQVNLLKDSSGYPLYDVLVRGRVITLGNAAAEQTRDLDAQVLVGLAAAANPATVLRSFATAAIVPQLLFTRDNWSTTRTVSVMAIDDAVVDGGDALVFPAFEERVNAIRGPLTVVGGSLAGEERFLNNPFRLPEETNDPQADGSVGTVTVDNNGNGVMTDHEAFHFNAIYGERPGFDPRMNSFPFEVTFLDGPAIDHNLDVLAVSKEILSVSRDDAFAVSLQIDGQSPTAADVRFSGTPEQAIHSNPATPYAAKADLKWLESVVGLLRRGQPAGTWTLSIDLMGRRRRFAYSVTSAGRALSKIVRQWADGDGAAIAGLNGLKIGNVTFSAEAQVDILGNAKIRITARDSSGNEVAFRTSVVISGGNGAAVVSGTPEQDFTKIFGAKWTVAAFEVLPKGPTGKPTGLWSLTLGSSTVSYATQGGSIADLTSRLADRIDSAFLPVVSGYTVTFAAPWPSEATSTLILSGAPEAGTTWTVSLDIAGIVKQFSHLVLAGDTLETISAALADAVNADPAGNLGAQAAGVALVVVNTAGNTLATTFAISPKATPLTPDPVLTYAQNIQFSGTPVAGDTWSVSVSFDNSGAPVTARQDYVVRATVALSEVADGLAAKINAAGSGFSASRSGNTLVIENAAAPNFATGTRITPSAETTGSFSRSVVSPTVTRLTLANSAGNSAAIGETWSVTIGGVTYAYTVESLEVIAAKLAAAVQESANTSKAAAAQAHAAFADKVKAAFVATSEGAPLLLANRLLGFSVTGALTPVTPSSGSVGAATTATAWAIDLGGTVVAGETWAVRLGNANFALVASAADTRASVARALAKAFNDAQLAGFRAVGDGTALVIANTDGAAFSLTTTVTAPSGNSAGTMTARAASAQGRTLSGTPVTGEVWAASITVAASSAAVEYVVTRVDHDGQPATARTPQTLNEVAASLAAAINADAQSGITALAVGSQVVVVERSGTAFSASFAVRPAGKLAQGAATPVARVATLPQALVAGQTLTVTLVGNDLSSVISYTVTATDGIVESAAAAAAHLAAAINARAPADYTAASDGATLLVLNRAGHRFTLADLLVIDTDEGSNPVIADEQPRRGFHRDCARHRDHPGAAHRGRVPGSLRKPGCALRRGRRDHRDRQAQRHAGRGRGLDGLARWHRVQRHGACRRVCGGHRDAPGRGDQRRHQAAGREVRRRRRGRGPGSGQPRRHCLRHRVPDHARVRRQRRHDDRDLGGGGDQRRPRQRSDGDAGDDYRRGLDAAGDDASLHRHRRENRRRGRGGSCQGDQRRRHAARGEVRRHLGRRPGGDRQCRRNRFHDRQLRDHRRPDRDDDQGGLRRHPRYRRKLD
ncbi:MAG: hypothetical protein IPK39_05825 [Sulfuritalea sp.]|nr:hypothetical protein [Sulfuritalea sp.]